MASSENDHFVGITDANDGIASHMLTLLVAISNRSTGLNVSRKNLTARQGAEIHFRTDPLKRLSFQVDDELEEIHRYLREESENLKRLIDGANSNAG